MHFWAKKWGCVTKRYMDFRAKKCTFQTGFGTFCHQTRDKILKYKNWVSFLYKVSSHILKLLTKKQHLSAIKCLKYPKTIKKSSENVCKCAKKFTGVFNFCWCRKLETAKWLWNAKRFHLSNDEAFYRVLQ